MAAASVQPRLLGPTYGFPCCCFFVINYRDSFSPVGVIINLCFGVIFLELLHSTGLRRGWHEQVSGEKVMFPLREQDILKHSSDM